MRIIDANKDFYDFYQNIYRDNHLTFDRRDSYNLSRKEFMDGFKYDFRVFKYKYIKESYKNRYILLQVCNSFWLFKLIITKYDECGYCLDYDLKLIDKWKDYSYKAELIKLSAIKFKYYIKDDDNKRIEAVKHKDYETTYVWNRFTIYKSNGSSWGEEERHIPILQNIGIASFIDPLDIYLALEEYFARQITDSERTESRDLTNNEKIENHGFDLKDSFRGKN